MNNIQYFIFICKLTGTGKTRTIAVAIAEIVRKTKDFILVCANSNSACDELTLRLLQFLSKSEIYRLYAKSFNKNILNNKILPICNLQGEEFKFPSLAYLYQFRVVVCTLMTAGSLTRARGRDRYFDPSHFSRVFIDEAACVHEPITIIPIAGIYFSIFELYCTYTYTFI